MTVCSHRAHEASPGFFTPCTSVCGGVCACGAEVAAEMLTEGDG